MKSFKEIKIDIREDAQDEKRMMRSQLMFMAYAAKEIASYLDRVNDPEEWYQNKMATTHSMMKTLYSYAQGQMQSMDADDDLMAGYYGEENKIDGRKKEFKEKLRRLAYEKYGKKKVDQVDESTKAYAASLEKIANDKKLKAITPKDREMLAKLADLMKKEGYRKPTAAEIAADKKKDGKKPEGNRHSRIKKKMYGNAMGGLKKEEVDQVDEVNKAHDTMFKAASRKKEAEREKAEREKRLRAKGWVRNDRGGMSKIKESVELGGLKEGRNDVVKALADKAKTGGIDKADFKKAHDLYKAAKLEDLKKLIKGLDTDVAEHIADVINRHDSKAFNSMYPRAKSGDSMAKIVREDLQEANFKPGNLKLKDGSKVKLSMDDAKAITAVIKTLSAKNRKEMETRLMSDKKGFDEIMAFVQAAGI